MPTPRKYDYPIDVKERTYLNFVAYNYETPSQNRRKNTSLNTSTTPTVTARRGNPLFEINTYIPAGFGDKISTRWEQGSVVFIGGSVRDVAESRNLAELGTSSSELVKSVAQKFILDKATQLLDATGYRDSIESFAQKRLAPNETLLFRGTNHRDLSVELKMTPKNRKESNNIIKIVDLMRYAGTAQFADSANIIAAGIRDVGRGASNLSKEYIGGIASEGIKDSTAWVADRIKGNAGNLFALYKYPPIFDIRIVRPEKQTAKSGSFVEYKSMAMLDFSVSYSDGSDVFEYFKDGTPVSTNLRLQFKSLYPVFKTQTFSDSRVTDQGGIIFEE